MLEEQNKRNKVHLINLIRKRSDSTPNFALLIGAGMSASSGVKTSSEMITEWRGQLYKQAKSSEPIEKWLRKQDWWENDEEYAILFEKIYDQRSQRRIYIEECVKNAKPSWGYIYLSNIIAHDYFNVVFTPNFDDLLNETCFLYAERKPIVCAHDSAVADIRVTSARPKIVKLHGDFLYDSIKNTLEETETLEKNMREKFTQFAREYGLVVVGYGGNDRSIMDILDMMLRSEGFFPNGIYWCRRKGDEVSRKLNRLMRQGNIYWVEIDGADEFMSELHDGLGLTLPDTVLDPYKATTERLNRFILPKKDISHPIIRKDIAGLEAQIKRFEEVVSGKAPIKEFDRLIPHTFLGDTQFARHDYKKALVYYREALVRDPSDLHVMDQMFWSYLGTEQFNEALKMSNTMIAQAPTDYRGYANKGRVLGYLNKGRRAAANFTKALGYTAEDKEARALVLFRRGRNYLGLKNWSKALSDSEESLSLHSPSLYIGSTLNKCMALVGLNREKRAREIIREVLPEISTAYNRAVAYHILGDKTHMLREMKTAIKEDRGNIADFKHDPAFSAYHENPDFRKIISEK